MGIETRVQGPVIAQPVARSRFAPRRLTPRHLVALALVLLICALFIIPFAWMISTALKSPEELMGTHWIPRRLAWENFSDAFSFGMWREWTINTLIITLLSVVGMTLSSSLVAYSFARLRWRGRDAMFSLVLATMMLPGVVLMIPQFVLFAQLPAFGLQGSKVWVNTFLPLIVPAFAGGAFNIFLLRQFMRTIPMELSEAARIDGASDWRIWWSVVLPLIKPGIATVAIFQFQGAWQDFMGPLLYLQSESKYTLQLGLRQFEAAAGGSPAWNWLMAASLLVILPVVIVFITLQRNFIEGISMTGMGGR
jgi:ABC-type glycerol-3-phosphate transport system permease component